MMKRIYIMICLTLSLVPVHAQTDKRDVRRGNRDFRKEEYREAEIDYRKAMVKDSLSVAANYNLASTLYRMGDMEQARKVLDGVKEAASQSPDAADYHYNLGDVALALQDYQTAVQAFAQSLLLNPDDLKAKENYIYAREKLKDQQNQQNQDGQGQNDQNQDQNQDQQDNKDNQNNKDNKDQQNDQSDNNQQDDKGQDNQDQQNPQQNQPQQNQPQQEPKITPQAAQQMLQAIQAKEKETQEKVNKEKAAALKSRQKDKNW